MKSFYHANSLQILYCIIECKKLEGNSKSSSSIKLECFERGSMSKNSIENICGTVSVFRISEESRIVSVFLEIKTRSVSDYDSKIC